MKKIIQAVQRWRLASEIDGIESALATIARERANGYDAEKYLKAERVRVARKLQALGQQTIAANAARY